MATEHHMSGREMTETGDARVPHRYLTVGWNNLLAMGLGLVTVAFAVVALTSTTFSDRAGFIGIATIGAVY